MSFAEKIRSALPELIRLWVTNIWYSRDIKICDVSLEDISFEDLAIFLESAFRWNEKTCKNFVQQLPSEYATKFLHAILMMDAKIRPFLIAAFDFRGLPVRVVQNFLAELVVMRPTIRARIFYRMREGNLQYLFQINPNISLLQGMHIHQRIAIQSRLDLKTRLLSFPRMFYGTKRFRYSAISKPLVEFVEDISDVYSQKRAVQYLREKCYLSPEASLYLMQLTRKNPDFPWNRAVGGSFLILKNFCITIFFLDVRPVAQPRNEGVGINPKKSFAHQKAQAMIRSYHRNPEKVRFTKNQFRFLLKACNEIFVGQIRRTIQCSDSRST